MSTAKQAVIEVKSYPQVQTRVTRTMASTLDDEKRTAGLPPPMHGEHTREILEEFGIAAEEIERLRSTRVIE